MKSKNRILEKLIISIAVIIAVILTSRMALATTTYELSGTWIFNEELDLPSSSITQDVEFSTGESEYKYAHILISNHSINYKAENGEISEYTYDIVLNDGWIDKSVAFRTFNFGSEPQAVSKEFYEWITANAVKKTVHTLNGIWKFKDIPDMNGFIDLMDEIYNESNYNIYNIDVKFTSNGIKFTSITEMKPENIAHGGSIVYENSDTTKSACTWNEDSIVMNGGDEITTWIDEAYKTINFGPEPQEVPQCFYDWFIENATEQPSCELSGTWKFNEVLTGISTEDYEAYIDFISNGQNFNYIMAIIDTLFYDEKYVYDHSLSHPVDGYTNWGMEDEKYRTVEFGSEPQLVPEEFYNWFTANATQIGSDEPNDNIDELIGGFTHESNQNALIKVNGTASISNISIDGHRESVETGSLAQIAGGVESCDSLIYVDNEATYLTLTNVDLVNNSGSENGGAIYLADGYIEFNGGKISGNISENGAILLDGLNNQNSRAAIESETTGVDGNAATFIFKDGSIINNESTKDGGAIYNDGCTVVISGGTVDNNRAQLGDAIYNTNSGIVQLKDSAYIDESNDIYLDTDTHVDVMNKLTKDKVAVITPNEYSIMKKIIELNYTTDKASAIYDKFELTPQDDWELRPSDLINNEVYNGTQDVVISKEYDLMFNPNTNKYVENLPDDTKAYHGEDLVLSDKTPTSSRLEFKGWKDTESNEFIGGNTYYLTSDTVLNAQWNNEKQNFVYLSTYGSINTTDGRKITPSDSNDGLTPETPIASFKKAYELLANTKGGTIYIVGNTIIDKNMTLTSEYYADDSSRVDITDGNITIKRYSQPTVNTDDNTLNDLDGYNVSSYKGILIELMSGKVINIGDESTGITIDGHRDESINSDLRLSADGVVANSSLIYNSGAIATIRNTTLVNNNITTSTNTQGGAILNQYGTLTLDRCTVENNSAYIGGGLANKYNSLIVKNSTITNNTSSMYAGGIYNDDGTEFIVDGCTISYNKGGGIRSWAKSTILNSDIAYNYGATQGGNGIYTVQNAVITNCKIHHNNGSSNGSGIYCYNAVLEDCKIYENDGYSGGGMYVYTSATLINTEIYDNTLSYAGGASREKGKAIYARGPIKVQGSSYIENNDVYLESAAYIEVIGELTNGDRGFEITPNSYSNGRVVAKVTYNEALKGSDIINELTLTPKSPYVLFPGERYNGAADTDVVLNSALTVVYFPGANDGSVTNLPATQNVFNSEEFKLSEQIPVRDGYRFVSWNSKYNLTGDTYKPGQSVILTSNLQLTAAWIPTPTYAYIDGINGDDYNDGLTPSTPIKTFKQAYTNLSKGGTIYVVNTVNIDTDTTLDKSYYEDSTSKIDMPEGSDITIKRYARPKEYESLQGFDVESNVNIMVHINTGYRLTLEDITIDGHKEAMTTGEVREITETGVNAKYAMIFNEGTLLINNGQLINNNNASTYSDGLVKRNYNEGNGGAIFNSGELTIQGGSISYNTAYSGGGAIFSDKIISIKGGLLCNNTAATGGALYVWDYTDAELTGGVFQDNIARGDAGGIYLSKGTFTVENIKVSGNTARNLGGGFGIGKYTTLVMRNSEITNNKSSIGGGFCNSGTTTSTLENVVITNNSSTSLGGGIAGSSSASITIGKGTVVSHNSSANGGGVYSGGEMLVDGAIISDNTATNGGGVYNDSSTTLLEVKGNTIINNNTAINQGGGIYSSHKNTKVTNSTISDNKAVRGGGVYTNVGADVLDSIIYNNQAEFGGGIFSSGILNLKSTEVSSNSSKVEISLDSGDITEDSQSTAGSGGGICSSGTLNLENSVIKDNLSNGIGAGLYLMNNSITNITDTVISNNESQQSGAGIFNRGSLNISGNTLINNNKTLDVKNGGGIYNIESGEIVINYANIKDNEAGFGAGIYNKGHIEFIDGVVDNNHSTGNGAGINNNSGGIVEIKGGKIINNKSDKYGGGINNTGANESDSTERSYILISDGEFYGNEARYGAAVANYALLDITGGKFHDNSASEGGGAVFSNTAGILNIVNTNMYNNYGKLGGAIFTKGETHIGVVTIESNTASKGKAIYKHSGDLYLEGTCTINTNNDIYLLANQFVYAKDLVGTDIVAILTPNTYTNGRTVVRLLENENDKLASDIIDRFELTTNGRNTLRPGDYVLESANILDTDIIISELFDVKFDKNTSAEVTNMPEDFTVYWCEPASIEDKTPIREYSEFLGWCKIPNPDISTYAVWEEDPSAMFYPGDSLIVKSNIIFYAIWDVEELILDAHIVKVLGDGAPIFKSGELGILVIDTVGFVEELEIDFPKEITKYDAKLDKIIEVNNDGNIRTKSRFIVPLRATPGIYTVIITAYGKDGNSLTVERDLQVIDSSILDGLRTTLR